MKNYIKNKKNFFAVSGINMIVKDDLNFALDRKQLSKVLDRLPRSFRRLVDYVIFGNFDFLTKMHFNAAFKDGAIYVSSTQIDNSSVIDDIIHEIGHAVEDGFWNEIYSDLQLEREFVKKRMQLHGELEKNGYRYSSLEMSKVEYDKRLDDFFYNDVGYPEMTSISQGIYFSPYGATSLREYFANGFEAYFYHKDTYLKKVSPVLYKKLEELENV
tara:strand:+ start:19411 stop:20055 length:645 start_codon:yes stop_codon:yes gene_type:complete